MRARVRVRGLTLGHGWQSALLSRPLVFPYVPEAHGSAADAPASQNVPFEHSSHEVALPALWKLPAGQSLHWSMPPCGATVPGLHARGAAAPVGHALPSGH